MGMLAHSNQYNCMVTESTAFAQQLYWTRLGREISLKCYRVETFMKRKRKLHLTSESLESRLLLTSLSAVSLTSTVFDFSGGFESTVLGGELTDLNNDLTGTLRPDHLDYAIIREGNVAEFWIHEGDGRHSRADRERLGGRPTLLVPGRLNNDAYDDYLVATDKGIEVFLNLGADSPDKTWRGTEKVGDVKSIATSMALARINNDSHRDLVITTGEYLEVHPGMGDGTFGPSISYPLGPGSHSLVVGDLNGDHHRDVVVGTQTDRTLTGKAVVFLNDGQGILEAGHTIDEAGPVRTMALADLNSDTQVELIVGTWVSRHLNDPGGENIHIWSGNGDGTFAQERADYETAGSPLDLAVDDLNSDGIVDLIVGHDSTFHHPITNNGPGGVSVLLGEGDGDLLSPVRISTPGGMSVSAVNSQITSFQQFGNNVRHFQWNHELGIAGEDFAEPVDNLYTRRTAATGDFNGDGTLDAAVTGSFQENSQITIHIRHADADPTQHTFDLPRSFAVNEMSTGDLNGDGFDDLAITGRTNTRIQTAGFLSNGGRTFSDAKLMSPRDFQPLEIVDINGDGLEDWLGVRFGLLVSLKSNPDGTREIVTLARSTNGFQDAVVSSRNEDGSANLLAISSWGVHSLVADSNGDYTESSVSASHDPFWTFGDFNGDDQMDVAFRGYSDPRIRAIFGSDGGELSQAVTVATREDVQVLATIPGEQADAIMLSKQAKTEIFSITADSTPDAPTFESTTVQTGELVGSAYVHNLLGDPTPDLVMMQGNNFFSSSPSTQILVAEAMPDGTYGQPRHLAVPLVEGRVLATDSTDDRIEFMFAHRWGFATVEIGPGKAGDFNFDGRIDTRDIDLLCAAHRDQDDTALVRFDLDGDDDLDDEDIDVWVREIAQTRRGDVNLDGKVNFQDFLDLSANFGQHVNNGFLGPGGWEQGDTNCDFEVTFADFLNISKNFGFGVTRQ